MPHRRLHRIHCCFHDAAPASAFTTALVQTGRRLSLVARKVHQCRPLPKIVQASQPRTLLNSTLLTEPYSPLHFLSPPSLF
eukprot:jgi/Botrbrau1/154/Bobra.0022s0139.1